MNKVKDLQQNVKREAEQLLTELRALGDEIRLKAHLANAEGRDAWKGLEPQLQKFGQHLETCGGNALGELRTTGNELRARLQRLWEEMRETRQDTPSN